ncbi:MAG: glutamyl-tRNA reductase, partial [Massilia sp.]|nr:glutamyl-tRNA reductase [Massilia sp.]
MTASAPTRATMQLLAVGLNHTTAPVSLREQLAFAPDQLGQAVRAARGWFARIDQHGGDEAAILSTCNRTELYAASRAPNPLDASAHFLADYHRLSVADLR